MRRLLVQHDTPLPGHGQVEPGRGPRLSRLRTDSRRACTPHTVTLSSCSLKMFPLILLTPCSRSVNVMGTSVIRKPFLYVRQASSTWKEYPVEAIVSTLIASSTGIRYAR